MASQGYFGSAQQGFGNSNGYNTAQNGFNAYSFAHQGSNSQYSAQQDLNGYNYAQQGFGNSNGCSTAQQNFNGDSSVQQDTNNYYSAQQDLNDYKPIQQGSNNFNDFNSAEQAFGQEFNNYDTDQQDFEAYDYSEQIPDDDDATMLTMGNNNAAVVPDLEVDNAAAIPAIEDDVTADPTFVPDTTNDNTNRATDTTSRRSGTRFKDSRKLMRWNPSVDQHVLLAVEYVCARDGIQIPWNQVARTVRDNLSAEAIKQHLLKLRRAREEAGQPNPPKFDRNKPTKAVLETPAQTPAKASSSRKRKHKNDDDDDDQEENGLLSTASKSGSLIYTKPKKEKMESEVKVEEDTPTKNRGWAGGRKRGRREGLTNFGPAQATEVEVGAGSGGSAGEMMLAPEPAVYGAYAAYPPPGGFAAQNLPGADFTTGTINMAAMMAPFPVQQQAAPLQAGPGPLAGEFGLGGFPGFPMPGEPMLLDVGDTFAGEPVGDFGAPVGGDFPLFPPNGGQ